MPYSDPKKKQAFDKENRKRTREKRKEYDRQYAASHPRFQRDRHLRQTYGITIEDVKRMYICQGGVCAICLEKFKSKTDMHVDHDHITNAVRQLLCSHCNRGIGCFKENVLILERAKDYVRKWNE